MRDWRASGKPPPPKSLQEFGDTLRENPWANMLAYSKGDMKVVTVRSRDSTSVVLFNPDFLKHFANSKEMILDGTFQITPLLPGVKCCQVVTILFTKFGYVSIFIKIFLYTNDRNHLATAIYGQYNNVEITYYWCLQVFPAVYALMENKFDYCYEDVLRVIAPDVPEVETVIADYEPAIRKAARRVFSQARFRGCNTHYMRVRDYKLCLENYYALSHACI